MLREEWRHKELAGTAGVVTENCSYQLGKIGQPQADECKIMSTALGLQSCRRAGREAKRG